MIDNLLICEFLGDIAIPVGDYVPKPKIKKSTLQEEVEQYKQEVLEGLQIEEEGLTDYMRKKTKQPVPVLTSNYNDPFDNLSVDPSHKNGQVLKSVYYVDDLSRKLSSRVKSKLVKTENQTEGSAYEEQSTNYTHNVNSTDQSVSKLRKEKNEEILHKRKKRHQNKRRRRNRVTRAATARKDRIWDYGVIPYEIDGNFSGMHKALFKQAMRHWENFTCVKFVERNRDEHQNYIIFTERPCGCCSFVGKRGNGGQAISIGKNCDKFGIVVHELGHVVGFWHEHTRPDRDNHVNIIRENIMSGQEYNFNKLNEEEVNSLGLTYDYDSIMHYARNTFSKGTYLDTIQPIDVPNRRRPEIGQRIRLSEGDIAQTNLLYKCPKCGRTYQANSATFSAPIYNDNIPEEGTKCEWRITATHGERIVLNITNLDIEKSQDCKTDYIEVRDGYWHKSQVLGLFCGTGKFHHIVSKTSRMLITYVAKNPKGHRGFTASYEEIRDGLTLQSPIMNVYCGQKVPPDVISTSNEMLVKFVSDGSMQKGGFSATIMKEYDECSKTDHGCEQHCINTLGSYVCSCRIGYELHSDGKNCEDACGGVFDVPNGTITSPSFPDLYPLNKNCVWEIVALPHHRITLNFTHFDLEGNNAQQQQCEYDRVDIYSKQKEGKLKKHGSHCGSKAPGLITSEGNVMRVVFYSDTSIQKTGFSAIFITDVDECATDHGGCQHDCINTLGSFICTCHNGYTLHENGKSCKEGGCKYEITAPHGAFGSPNYPDYYPARKDCVWHFTTTPGHRIRISFQTFDLEPHQECSYDHLDIYDGPSPESPSLGRHCGAKLPHLIVSSGNQLYMSFRSDASVQRAGFWATHSTFGRASYENRADCDWTIESALGYNVKLSFLTFDIEDEKECGYDYVQIFSGMDSSAPTFGKYCGTRKPFDIISTHEALLVRFKTDDTLVGKGFSLVYEAVEVSFSEEEI
ncbi:hypothetical protein NQ315_012762 [Exocentrus adspersus]|uniref:Metalloendopeptidase n=1 Tax=Exocentrus adspersus TaxID=1586481 RepID=A0AAV8VDP1_9CUCU|nr:hypothetical protein NQ315_012762 [Exocentrus adspersus]